MEKGYLGYCRPTGWIAEEFWFDPRQQRPDRLWAPRSLVSNKYGARFPQVQSGRDVKLIAAMLSMRGAKPPRRHAVAVNEVQGRF